MTSTCSGARWAMSFRTSTPLLPPRSSMLWVKIKNLIFFLYVYLSKELRNYPPRSSYIANNKQFTIQNTLDTGSTDSHSYTCFIFSHTEGSSAEPGASIRGARGQGQRELQPGGQPPRPQHHLVSWNTEKYHRVLFINPDKMELTFSIKQNDLLFSFR